MMIYKWLKDIVVQTPLYFPIRNMILEKQWQKELAAWHQSGRPAPPPHLFKQRILQQYAEQYDLRVFVETGTYYGDMVQAMLSHFDALFSIELSPELHRLASRRFKSHPHVHLILGDSADSLPGVVGNLSQAALFWLDGHYSGGVTARGNKETPILDELGHLLVSSIKNHVIIIDDAHLFGTNAAYPSIDALRTFIFSTRQDVSMEVLEGIIRVTPK